MMRSGQARATSIKTRESRNSQNEIPEVGTSLAVPRDTKQAGPAPAQEGHREGEGT